MGNGVYRAVIRNRCDTGVGARPGDLCRRGGFREYVQKQPLLRADIEKQAFIIEGDGDNAVGIGLYIVKFRKVVAAYHPHDIVGIAVVIAIPRCDKRFRNLARILFADDRLVARIEQKLGMRIHAFTPACVGAPCRHVADIGLPVGKPHIVIG